MMAKLIFLFLSLISGSIELGGIIQAIIMKLSVLQVVGIGLAYQIGNLVPNPVKLNKTLTVTASLLSFLCFMIVIFYSYHYWIVFAGFGFIAMAIQSLRSMQKENVGTTVKRVFRIAGFLLAPFCGLIVTGVIAVLLLTISLFSKWQVGHAQIIKPELKFINTIMIIHQMHYFSYAYFMIILISQITTGLNPVAIGILFTLGWLSYTSVSHLLRNDTYEKYLIVGHVFLTVILLLLALNYHSLLAVILWILTGFGGGTVFCIDKINQLTKESTKSDLTFSENIGHILGVIAGMTGYIFTGKVNFPVYLSVLFAGTVVLLMLIYTQNTKFVSARKVTVPKEGAHEY